MANGDVNVLKGRDQALRVAKTTGVKPPNETTGSSLMVGDTQFEFQLKNNSTKEDCRGAANLISINGTSDISFSVSHSSLLSDESYETLKKASKDKTTVWCGKQMVAGLDWNGLWNVTEWKETIGLDESVKSTFTLEAAGAIQFPTAPRPLTTTP